MEILRCDEQYVLASKMKDKSVLANIIVSLITLDNETFLSFFMLYHSKCMVAENFVKLLTVISCSLIHVMKETEEYMFIEC